MLNDCVAFHNDVEKKLENENCPLSSDCCESCDNISWDGYCSNCKFNPNDISIGDDIK